MMDITTIKLRKNTKNRLDKLKTHKRDSYEDITQRILEILNLCRLNPLRAKAKLMEIDKMNSLISKENSIKSH